MYKHYISYSLIGELLTTRLFNIYIPTRYIYNFFIDYF